MKHISLLGSTGSIGKQTLEVVAANPYKLKVRALAAHRSDELLEQQIRQFEPDIAVLSDKDAAARLAARYHGKTKILAGDEGLLAAATYDGADTVLASMVGYAGLRPTLAAIECGKNIALANKETLVAGGRLVTDCIKQNNVQLLPIDSEHSAIFQCLIGAGENRPSKILLTASGGPFYGKTRDDLRKVTVEQALKHPNWSMGAKITIDSATLMNKGLELIEAVRLFDVRPEQVEIVVHRQSIIHSAVEFEDGAVIAQLGSADMRIPIQLALTYPERLPSPAKKLSLFDVGQLTFGRADEGTFTCLAAAKKAISLEGNAPCIVNSANEAAVALFLDSKIKFLDIGDVVNGALETVKFIAQPTLEDILDTRRAAEEYVAARFGN